jgi:transposase
VIANEHPDTLDPEQLRQALRAARAEVALKDELLARRTQEVAFKQAVIDKLTHENAVLKRLKFAAKSEAYTVEQKSLLEETLDMDLAAVAAEIEALQPRAKPADEKKQPKRTPLPPHLPRREIRHEPENTTCDCGQAMQRIGEDVAEKLDYQPGVFTVERHVRGKWVCGCCEKLVQAPVAPHIIDKGLPTTGLLAQVLVAKYLDHLPPYRQEAIFERAGHAIVRSTLAQWVGECGVQLQPLVDALSAELLRQGVLHADETPVAMLKPGHGKTHRAYLWSYCTTQFNPIRAVVFDFADSRGGQHARAFLRLPGAQGWRGKLVCDDYTACEPHRRTTPASLAVSDLSESSSLAHTLRHHSRTQQSWNKPCCSSLKTHSRSLAAAAS